MPDSRVTVVVSQGQSRSPDKRQLENGIAEGAANIPGVDVLVIPHLYDLPRDAQSYQRLRSLEGPIVLCAWLFDRAAHWVLDRNGVRGQVGQCQLKPAEEGEEESDGQEAVAVPASVGDGVSHSEDSHVVDAYPRPSRAIYCLDLKDKTQAADFLREIGRIVELESSRKFLQGSADPTLIEHFERPRNSTYVGGLPAGAEPVFASNPTAAEPTLLGTAGVMTIEEHPSRRWYPVIDFSRCTNCMECIDFCLFGVYGVDQVETILVEQPDNCRKGCPACSRVCPQNAIIFPQHKTPAIAGAPMDASGLKIDLSKLFGAPDEGADAIEVAARERDEQLILAGRRAVGLTEDLQARLSQGAGQPRDELDRLIDQLDDLEL